MSTIPETAGTSALKAPLSAAPSTQTSSLERYLAQIPDPTLRENLSREIAGMGRNFGLVFERHHPEGIRLPKHKVKRGSKVIINTVKDSGYYRVARLAKDDGPALLVDDDGNEAIYPVSQLTVAKEFGDVMYPGLKKLSEVRRGTPDAPVHTIINGENFHALEALQYTHSGKVDLIYIDPPYNTGNADWKYNDRYIDSKDGYRHSKWLSFMEKRLLIAKQLLKESGVIFVSIGHDEHHRLRMLLDSVFGERNFISSITRTAGPGSRQYKHVKQTSDYILVYAKAIESSPTFIEPVNPEYVARFNSSDGTGKYREEPLYRSTLASVGRKSMRFYIECPDGSLCIPPGNVFPTDKTAGAMAPPQTNEDKIWRWSESTLERNQSIVTFKRTSKSPLLDEHGNRSAWNVYAKQYLNEEMGMTPTDVWGNFPNRRGAASLKGMNLSFDYSKPVDLIDHICKLIGNPGAVVLDFFAGSGTAAEAVIRLNAEDGGTRQAILVTNNELSKKDDVALRTAGHVPGDDAYESLGVFHHVTKPRLETVITGVREDGSKYSDGLDANVAFFELTYLDEPEIVTGKDLGALAGLFWLKAGGTGGTMDIDASAKRDGFAISESGAAAVLFTPGRAKALSEKLKAERQDIRYLFIVTDSEAQGDEAASHFPSGINVERIYGSYLEAFQVNRKD